MLLSFYAADVEVLKQCRPQIKAMIPSLTDNHFFAKLLKQDITARALITKSTNDDTYVDEDDFYGPQSRNIRNRNMVSVASINSIVPHGADCGLFSSSGGT